MNSFLLKAIGVVLIFLSIFYVYFTWTFDYWKKRGLFYLKPTPVVGNFGNWAFLKADVGTMFKQIYEKSKLHDIVGIWVFRKPSLVVNSPQLIKSVLVKEFHHFSNRSTQADRSYDPLGADNLFFGKNPHWKEMRIKLTHLFSSSKMKNMFHLMNDIGNDLENCIEKSNGKPIEVRDLTARYTTDVIATTAYGLKDNALGDERAPFNIFRKRLLDFRWIRAFMFMSIFFLQEFAKFAKCKVFENDCADWLRTVFWKAVDDREKTKNVRNDLIGTLIALRDEAKDNEIINFSGDSLVAQAAIFFTAGNESSSTTMSFLLYELALQPELQDKLYQEIEEVLLKYDNTITYDGLQELPFLDMCFKETLRKYPPLPFLDRECTIPYKVPGTDYTIPKGMFVYVPMMGLHWDPDYFPEPEKFKPERFNKENSEAIRPFTFMPFGEGPRICIGERFGSMQSRIGMIHIMRRFKIQTCSRTQIPLTFQTLTLSPTSKEGIYLEFVPRTK